MYLFDVFNEIKKIPKKEASVATIAPVVRSKYPNLFTPFNGWDDAGKALVSPITDPLLLGLVAAVLFGESIANAASSLCLTTASIAALYHGEYHKHKSLNHAATDNAVGALGLAFSAIGFALLAVLTTPVLALHALARVVTTAALFAGTGFVAAVDACSVAHRQVGLEPSRYV